MFVPAGSHRATTGSLKYITLSESLRVIFISGCAASSASSGEYGYASNPTSSNFGQMGQKQITFLLENVVAYFFVVVFKSCFQSPAEFANTLFKIY